MYSIKNSSKKICHFDGLLVVRDQVLVPDFILSTDLVDYQLRIPKSFEIFDPQLLGETESNEKRIVLGYVIGTWTSQ